MKSLFLSAILTSVLLFAGCSSDAKKNAVEDGLTDLTSSALEINGDSDSGKAGALQTIYFDFNSSQLTPSTRSTLEANASFLKENETVEVQIEGHCDERGGVQYNLALGERRAQSVRDYLIAMGVDSRRVSIISFGKERPIAFGHEESAWSQNRRGNFVITAK